MYYNNRPGFATGNMANANPIPCRNTCSANDTYGMAYVPMQKWGEIYDLDKAYACATIFPDLVKPFRGRRS